MLEFIYLVQHFNNNIWIIIKQYHTLHIFNPYLLAARIHFFWYKSSFLINTRNSCDSPNQRGSQGKDFFFFFALIIISSIDLSLKFWNPKKEEKNWLWSSLAQKETKKMNTYPGHVIAESFTECEDNPNTAGLLYPCNHHTGRRLFCMLYFCNHLCFNMTKHFSPELVSNS